MYDTEVISNIIEDAKQLVAGKRKKYDKLMKVIEYFISENDIIVKEISDYFFDLYTFNMFNLPTKLTDLLYETDPVVAKYVTLEIKIYKYHSKISIDGIPFVHFTYINSEIRQNILDYTCMGLHTKLKCKCFGPEVLLINHYADLVNPSLSNGWIKTLLLEEKMSDEILSHLRERVGGSERKINKRITLVDQMMEMYYGNLLKVSHKRYKNNIDIEYSIHANIHSDVNKYRNLLLNNYICDEHVLIGQIAINVYINNNKLGRIQIVTSRSFTEEIKLLKGLLGGSISYSINNLKIPTNLNLHKMTIFYEKEAIIDIYDAGNFELINYNKLWKISEMTEIKSSINIGTPFVVMRFRLIDVWSTLYNMKAGNLSKDIAMPVVHRLISEYTEMRNKMNDMDIDNIFPLNYIGYLEDSHLNKLRIAARLKIKFIQPYLPFLAKK